MLKPEQVLLIEPQHELKFKGPFNASVTSYMKLTNPSDKRVMFKIKTTAPKKYCVRPNSGVIEPNTSTEVSICLQPFLFDPAEKNKHKFMVQTAYTSDGEVNFEQIWKEISPEELMDSKLKCVFEMPPEHLADGAATGAAAGVTGSAAVNREGREASPPKPVSAGNNAVIESELHKAAQEVQQLREEESSLRQENLRLKEELMQMKMQLSGTGNRTASAPQAAAAANRYAPPSMVHHNDQQIPMAFVILAIISAVIGVILGKFAL